MPDSFHPTRRGWLRCAAAAGLLWTTTGARAADFKALVSVSLYGGNDGMNMVVPIDSTRHAQYSAVRQALALPQGELLSLAGEPYGLHPAMAALHGLWNQRRLAAVFNVGPLVAPLTKAQYRALNPASSQLPGSLYSHSDQQTLWETASATPLARTGWGGRASEALATAMPVIAAGQSGRFGISTRSGPLVVSDPGTVFGAIELDNEPWRLQYRQPLARANALRALYAQQQGSVLGQAVADIGSDAFAMSQRLATIVKTQPGDAGANSAIGSAFASLIVGSKVATPIGRQLYQIAKLIAARATVGGERQIYAASQGGYDTHGAQADANPASGAHAGLLRDLSNAVAAFDQAMRNLGLDDAVTLFTQSDFGRTFKPNNSGGTDHGWGNHQFVVGGAVQGGRSYGSYPELVLGGPDDVGVEPWELQGRWIPTLSVAQYAAPLLRWFGASAAQIDAVLPNLANFAGRPLPAFV